MISPSLILPVRSALSDLSTAVSLLKLLFSHAAPSDSIWSQLYQCRSIDLHLDYQILLIYNSIRCQHFEIYPPISVHITHFLPATYSSSTLAAQRFLLHSKCCCGGRHLHMPLTALPLYRGHLIPSLTFSCGDAPLTCEICLEEILQLRHTPFILASLLPSKRLMI